MNGGTWGIPIVLCSPFRCFAHRASGVCVLCVLCMCDLVRRPLSLSVSVCVLVSFCGLFRLFDAVAASVLHPFTTYTKSAAKRNDNHNGNTNRYSHVNELNKHRPATSRVCNQKPPQTKRNCQTNGRTVPRLSIAAKTGLYGGAAQTPAICTVFFFVVEIEIDHLGHLTSTRIQLCGANRIYREIIGICTGVKRAQQTLT